MEDDNIPPQLEDDSVTLTRSWSKWMPYHIRSSTPYRRPAIFTGSVKVMENCSIQFDVFAT